MASKLNLTTVSGGVPVFPKFYVKKIKKIKIKTKNREKTPLCAWCYVLLRYPN